MEHTLYTTLIAVGALLLGFMLFFIGKRLGLKGIFPFLIAGILSVVFFSAAYGVPGRVYVVDEKEHEYVVTQYRVWSNYTVETDSIDSESVRVPPQSVLLVNRTDDYPFVSPLIYGSDDFLEEDSIVYSSPHGYVLVPKAKRIDFYPDEVPPNEISTRNDSEYKYHLEVFSLDEEMDTEHEH